MSSTSIQAKMFKAVSASATAIAAVQSPSGAGNMTLTGSAVNDGSNMSTTVTLTSANNNASVSFTITGTDANGDAVSETIGTGPNAQTLTGSTKFLTVTQISHSATISAVSAGFTATTDTTGIVFAGATRVRGMHGVSKASTAGHMIIRNGSQTGGKRLQLDAPASAGMMDPYIPDEGIRYPDGAYIDISSGFDSVTVFYDGSY
jgi:hypothetical protein